MAEPTETPDSAASGTAPARDLADETVPDAIGKPAVAAWQRLAARPGRRALLVAGFVRILAACATVALWIGVSLAAQRMLEHADPLPALALAGAAGVLHAVIARLSLVAEGRGRQRIAAGLRRRVARLVDGVSREGRDIDPATASGAVVDWCANVADYLSKAVPLRPAAAGEMTVTWLAVTIVYWPAGILLLMAMMVVVANLRLSGILARDGSDEAMGLLQRLGAQILDTFSGVDVLVRFGAVKPFADRIRRSSKRHTAALMKVLQRAFISNLVMSATVTLSMAVIATFVGFALLGYVGVPAAPLNLGRGMLALTLCPVFFSPLESMASIFHTRQDADAATRSLIRLGVGLGGGLRLDGTVEDGRDAGVRDAKDTGTSPVTMPAKAEIASQSADNGGHDGQVGLAAAGVSEKMPVTMRSRDGIVGEFAKKGHRDGRIVSTDDESSLSRVSDPAVSDPVHEPVRILAHSLVMRDAQGRVIVGADGEIARPGGWTAIVGPSGSGKTTLLRAFSGLSAPGSGRVEWMTVPADAGDVGDFDVREANVHDREADGKGGARAPGADDRVGYAGGSPKGRFGRIVPRPGAATWIGQSTLIIDAPLRDNLRLGALYATNVQLQVALRDVGLESTVTRLADGLDTMCGSAGWRFSTGELRRIAIARALLRGSSVWLLDEPTEHLDPDTEQEVLDALKKACAGRTVIIATHSPAVIDRADRVFAIGPDHVLRAAKEGAGPERADVSLEPSRPDASSKPASPGSSSSQASSSAKEVDRS